MIFDSNEHGLPFKNTHSESIQQMKHQLNPQVYFVPLNNQFTELEFNAGLALGWLTEDEINKVNRYKIPQARHHALLVRLGLRAVLSLHSNIKPCEWRFEYGNKGKPCLQAHFFAQTGLYFNLSHSGEWLMIGIVDTSLQSLPRSKVWFGVDIERERSNTNIQSILNHYFSQAEVDALLALPESIQRQRFFDLWALKESYIKARGLGLALSLKSFSFEFLHKAEPLLAFNLLKLNKSKSQIDKINPLPLITEIALDVNQSLPAELSDTQWQSCLGRLNDHYRFAITIGNRVSEQRGGEQLANEVYADGVNLLSDIVFHQVEFADLLAGFR